MASLSVGIPHQDWIINNGWWIDWIAKSGNQFKLHGMINRLGSHTQISFSFFFLQKKESSSNLFFYSHIVRNFLILFFRHFFGMYLSRVFVKKQNKKKLWRNFKTRYQVSKRYKEKHQATKLICLQVLNSKILWSYEG